MRRIERRMVAVGARTVQAYLEELERDGAELDHLHRDLLIGVTKFFRDAPLFRTIETQVIPAIFERPGFDGVVRIWTAGCSTGEEAYSIAMLVREYCEHMKIDADVKVFATDVDRAALERASSGVYPEGIAADVSAERLARFFNREENGFRVVNSLRNMLVFAPQNLLTDPPFTRIDLITCRNVLIYLEPAAQRKLLAQFHFALRPEGFLFLGGAESVGDLVGGFSPVDVRAKLYRRNGGRVEREGSSWQQDRPRGQPSPRPTTSYDRDRAVMLARFHAALVERYAPTSLLVDRLGHILQSSGEPQRYLRFPPGVASLDITKVARPGLSPMLATAVQRVLRERNEVSFEDVRVETDDRNDPLRVTLRVRPVGQGQGQDAAVDYLLVSFEPRDRVAPPEPEGTTVTRDDYVEALESELRHNRDNLSATIEELETANEELQATNEELLAANEELQSTNEELLATNEELHTVNAEHQRKIVELEELNSDIDNFFRTSHVGTLFLSSKLEIRRFTPAATTVVNMMDQDIGRPLDHLSDRIGGGALLAASRRVLERGGGEDMEAEVDGRSLLIQLRPYEGRDARDLGVVLTFVDVTELAQARRRQQAILDSLPERVGVVDDDGVIRIVNRAWREQFSRGEVDVGANYLEVVRRSVEAGNTSARAVLEGLQRLLSDARTPFEHEYLCHEEGQQRWFILNAHPLRGSPGAVLSLVDVTRRVLAEQ